jgi:xylulose-5-phosphate/fructose-6-phosphate phosphoketolase
MAEESILMQDAPVRDGTNNDTQTPLTPELLAKMDAYWRAANYLSVGQIYLKDNPLLQSPLKLDDIKPRLLGHWGTTPGLNFLYVHLNRVINERNLNMMYIIGPGHGGPGLVANTYLEGSYTELFPAVEQNADGIKRLFRQFSWPLGIPSHVAPETPGSIHEGGELGYSLVHAYGAAFDNPDLLVACVVGDGEAETGPLATSWHSNKFLNPATDGAVLPILHLNGFKIANPTVLARIPHAELEDLMRGYGYEPFTLEGHDPATMHQGMAAVLETMLDRIAQIQKSAREEGNTERPRWPMLILKTLKGWTGPKFVDGKPVEGTWRAHQVPFAEIFEKPDHLRLLDEWMRSYKPEELFDPKGHFNPDLADLAPKGQRRMGMNPHANGGLLLKPLTVPNFRDFAIKLEGRGQKDAESTKILGQLLHAVMQANLGDKNFRVFGPDETASNRIQDVITGVGKAWMAETLPVDENLSETGRVMEVLSEHLCQGWLEGYLLTGRHGFFSCYEAFIHIVDSMVNQHAKWLKVTREIPWRKPIASLNYLLTSHVWRQDHNGFSIKTQASSTTCSTRRQISSVSICRPMLTRCSLSPIIACAAATTSTSSSPASSPSRSGSPSTRQSSTAPPALASGRGPPTPASPTWSWPAVATFQHRKPWPRRCSSARKFQTSRSA